MLIRGGVIFKHQSLTKDEVELSERKEIQDIEEQMKSPFLQYPQVCIFFTIIPHSLFIVAIFIIY